MLKKWFTEMGEYVIKMVQTIIQEYPSALLSVFSFYFFPVEPAILHQVSQAESYEIQFLFHPQFGSCHPVDFHVLHAGLAIAR